MNKFLLALVTLLLLLYLAPAAAAPDPGEQARVQQAVQAYVAMQQAQTEQQIDQRITNAADALLNDPASPVIGNPKAPGAIVEFFDYACSYCKAAEPRLEAAIKANKGARLVLKEFPILTPESMIAARVSLAAARQGKYTAFHQALMLYRGAVDGACYPGHQPAAPESTWRG